MSSATYSNTRVQRRQPSREDSHFISLVKRMGATGYIPSEDEQLELGTWLDAAIELVDAIKEDGLAGFSQALQALTNSNPRMAALLATEQDQDQEELSPDLKIGHNGKKVYRTLTEDDIDEFPDVTWLVSGILQTATVSMLFGESNSGKTFLALHTAQCIARGINWLGRPVEQGPVLYIYAEGKLGLKPRLRAWRKHYQLPTTANVQYIAHPVQLLSDRQTLIDTLEDQDQRPALIVIDTFSNCASGINQNDQEEVQKVLAVAHEIVRDYSAHVLVVHHTNKSGLFNGTQAFRNHVDTMMELSRDGIDGPLTLHCEKQREAGHFSDVRLSLKVEDLGVNERTLEPLSSCVIVASSSPAAEITSSQTEEKMLHILALQGRTSYNTWKKACEEARVTKATAFYGHVEDLVKQGRVKKDAEGPGKKTWYEVVEPSQPVQPVQTSSPELDELVTN